MRRNPSRCRAAELRAIIARPCSKRSDGWSRASRARPSRIPIWRGRHRVRWRSRDEQRARLCWRPRLWRVAHEERYRPWVCWPGHRIHSKESMVLACSVNARRAPARVATGRSRLAERVAWFALAMAGWPSIWRGGSDVGLLPAWLELDPSRSDVESAHGGRSHAQDGRARAASARSDAPPAGPDVWASVARAIGDRDRADVVARARLLGMPVAPAAATVTRAPWFRRRVDGISKRRSADAAPLVVDLSTLWAGPLAASLLGVAGARVIKVESTSRSDGARRGAAPFYARMNAGKESVALDLASSGGAGGVARLDRPRGHRRGKCAAAGAPADGDRCCRVGPVGSGVGMGGDHRLRACRARGSLGRLRRRCLGCRRLAHRDRPARAGRRAHLLRRCDCRSTDRCARGGCGVGGMADGSGLPARRPLRDVTAHLLATDGACGVAEVERSDGGDAWEVVFGDERQIVCEPSVRRGPAARELGADTAAVWVEFGLPAGPPV